MWSPVDISQTLIFGVGRGDPDAPHIFKQYRPVNLLCWFLSAAHKERRPRRPANLHPMSVIFYGVPRASRPTFMKFLKYIVR